MEDIRYRWFAPPADLAAHVDCFWFMRSDADRGGRRMVRVLPDGCVDVVFDIQGCLASEGASATWSPRAFAVGPTDRSYMVGMEGNGRACGIRFRPGGAACFIKPAACEVGGGPVDLDHIFPGQAGTLLERMALEPDMRAQARILARALRRLLDPATVEAVVGRAVELIWSGRGIGQTANELGVGIKRLERLFKRHVGLGPKRLGRVLRFNRTVSLVRDRSMSGWAELAVEAGYSDQAHFIREFKRMSGTTPGRFMEEDGSVQFIQYDLAGFR